MKITVRERNAILQSLGAGVVPAIGLHHIQVGRQKEVEALLADLALVESGSATFRIVVGPYGSGKTFFLNLIRTVALERKFVAVQADITTERRLYASDGSARALFSELMRNLATRSKPEGGALPNLIERWVGDLEHEIRTNGGSEADVKKEVENRLKPLQDLVSGFDFAHVLTRYYEGYLQQNEQLQQNAIRWLRAEYTTKTQAREDLGVRSIIDDASFYDYLKLIAGFVRIAGYAGLLVNVDELTVLSHRLANTTARNNNYEAILRILNDCLQGRASGLAFLLAGTDDCLSDKRRGLYSYEALARRLPMNRFANEQIQDFSGPVLQLQSLRLEDCFVLLNRITDVYANGVAEKHLVPPEGIEAFLRMSGRRFGMDFHQKPSTVVTEYVQLLNTLNSNPSANWQTLLEQLEGRPVESADSVTGSAGAGKDDKAKAKPADEIAAPDDSEDLARFRL